MSFLPNPQISQMIRSDAVGKTIGLRYFYSWQAAGSVSELVVNLWTALVISLSVLLLWLNYSLCMTEWGDWDPEFGRRDLSGGYRLVKRFHLVVHFIRCVHSFRDCLHLKVTYIQYSAGCASAPAVLCFRNRVLSVQLARCIVAFCLS